MSVYNFIHYILFTVTQIANPHLLLDESFQIIWGEQEDLLGHHRRNLSFVRPPSSTQHHYDDVSHQGRQQQQHPDDPYDLGRFIHNHVIIFITSIVAFIGSIRTLERVDKNGEHRQYLINSMVFSLIFHLVYLYAFNTLASNNHLVSSADYLKAVHTIIMVTLITGFQWAHASIGSISDSPTLNGLYLQTKNDNNNNKSNKTHHHSTSFTNHLMVGSLSLAFASVSLGSLCIVNHFVHRLGFTNIALALGFISLGLELICLQLFTSNSSPAWACMSGVRIAAAGLVPGSKGGSQKSKSYSVWSQAAPKMKRAFVGEHQRKKPDCGNNPPTRKSLHADIVSISAPHIVIQSERGRETWCLADDEEFDNSIDLFHISDSRTFRNATTNNHLNRQENHRHYSLEADGGGGFEVAEAVTDHYDKSKFSLYEDFSMELESSQQQGQPSKPATHVADKAPPTSGAEAVRPRQAHKRKQFSTWEILLLTEDRSFFWRMIILLSIGSIHQANQLCFFADYLPYLVHRSPLAFRSALLKASLPFIGHEDAPPNAMVPNIVWAELACVSLLIQSLGRILCLHYVDSIVLKVRNSSSNHRATFLSLAVAGSISTILAQFLSTHYLCIQSDCHFSSLRVALVLGLLAAIQFQFGLIGALADYLINDMALEHAQRVAKYRSMSRLRPVDGDARGSVHCTVHGILRGTFYSLGNVSMTALSLVVNFIVQIQHHNHQLVSSTNERSGKMLALISLAPIIVILSLVSILCLNRWRLIKQAAVYSNQGECF